VISFLQRHPKIAAGHVSASENLGAMLLEILELYGTRFNFDRVGIAVDNGGSYFDTLSYQRIHNSPWRKISIRDPSNEGNNIAKASHQMDAIIKCFGDAYRALSTRCYLVNLRIKSGDKAPWDTRRGSLLDAIIEAPALGDRERIRNKWKKEMRMDVTDQTPIPNITIEGNHAYTTSEEKAKKPNRAERRAVQTAQKAAAKKSGNNVQIIVPPKTNNNPLSPNPSPLQSPIKSPGRGKGPTAIVTGTKDAPIYLSDDSVTTNGIRNSPKKKTQSFTSRAAENLAATGSVTGVPKNANAMKPIAID
jgi:DNA polymerase sigma